MATLTVKYPRRNFERNVTGSTPDEVFTALKSRFPELENGAFDVSTSSVTGNSTMEVFLREGSKA